MTRHRRRQRGPAPLPPMRLIVPEFPGVSPELWTELPPAAYPPNVAELIRGVLDARQTGEIVTVNGWRCQTCAGVMVVRDLHPGVVPAYVDHRRFVPATLCPGVAVSLDYPRHVELGAPEFEWYRPSETELLTRARQLPTIADPQTGDRIVNHVLRGGLLLRPIPTGAP